MRIGSVNGNGLNASNLQMGMAKGMDAVSKNIQKQIADAQKQLQELGENKDMPLQDKMKKRQEIQQRINELQNQLRQHILEQKKESQRKNDSAMGDGDGSNRKSSKSQEDQQGLSSASMQAMLSADSSMDKVEIQGAAKSQAEGTAGVLKSEIKLDAGRGGSTDWKREELEKVESRAQDIEASQMNGIIDINRELRKAAEEERRGDGVEEADNIQNMDVASSEKSGEDMSQNAAQPEDYRPIDVISDGLPNRVIEAEGNVVDEKR